MIQDHERKVSCEHQSEILDGFFSLIPSNAKARTRRQIVGEWRLGMRKDTIVLLRLPGDTIHYSIPGVNYWGLRWDLDILTNTLLALRLDHGWSIPPPRKNKNITYNASCSLTCLGLLRLLVVWGVHVIFSRRHLNSPGQCGPLLKAVMQAGVWEGLFLSVTNTYLLHPSPISLSS